MKESLEASHAWDINSPPAQLITNMKGDMMVLDNQPFMIAEDLGFVRLMKHVSPRYKIPSRHHFSETVIPKLVKRAETAVEKLLQGAEHISFTSDIWTCSFPGVTPVSESRRSLILCCQNGVSIHRDATLLSPTTQATSPMPSIWLD